jgi:hypothetical protein
MEQTEDQDISWRFLQAGLTLRYAPAAVVFHRHHLGVGLLHPAAGLGSRIVAASFPLRRAGRPRRSRRAARTAAPADRDVRARGLPSVGTGRARDEFLQSAVRSDQRGRLAPGRRVLGRRRSPRRVPSTAASEAGRAAMASPHQRRAAEPARRRFHRFR